MRKVRVCHEVEVKYIQIDIPVRYDDEDIPFDFPLRDGKEWHATVEIETGRIVDWPAKGQSYDMYMKVTDEGIYTLLDENFKKVVERDGYVPEIVPGDYGDYVDLNINEEGIITNWDSRASLEQFDH